MSNGRPWTPRDDALVRRHGGKKPDAEIAAMTGHSERTIRDHRNAMMIPAYQHRPAWTQRDWLLASAAGLDFQIPGCRY